MAFGKNIRMDPRRPSSYASTTILVVFVALCLVGIWMTTSSTVVPVELSQVDKKPDMEEEVPDTNSKPTGDNPHGVYEDVTKGKTNTNVNTAADGFNSESSTKTPENSVENTQGEDPVKGIKDELNEISKSQADNDANVMVKGPTTTEGEDLKSEAGKTNAGVQEDGKKIGEASDETKNKNDDLERVSGETENKDQEKNTVGTSNENSKDEQDKSSDQSSSENTYAEQQLLADDNKSPKEKSESDTMQVENGKNQIKEKIEQLQDNVTQQTSGDNLGSQVKDQGANKVFPDGAQSEILNETNIQNGAWSTQASESKIENEVQATSLGYSWKLCSTSAKADYIPCLDNEDAIRRLRTTKHYEHRERHCPEEASTCLVPLPDGYQRPIKWPKSRDKIWYSNVPHTKLVAVKGHQNWVKVSGDFLIFPGGGTQFKNGALHYIDNIQKAFPDIAWGKKSRVVLDVGCGVASLGGYLFERDVLTMSFAPKDEHEAQVQFALERGIPAILAVMGTKRLPYPGRVFDVIHCARCRVPWHIEGGMLLLELNRLLRPGGYFVWSATPVYQNSEEDVGIWKAMSELTKSMCWDLVKKTKDTVNKVGIAIYRKPLDNACYETRKRNTPPLCEEGDDPNAAWNIPLQACMHRLPVDPVVRGSQWPEQWPQRLEKAPYWLNNSQVGVYGKAAPEDFQADYEHWKHVVSNSYLSGLGIDWSTVRNVMDMKSVYGGFAASLRDLKVWVMNIVPIDSPDSLPIIYERGLFGMYHDWCESFSTYPRTYDLLHAGHLFSNLKKRCKLLPVVAEMDRILRPEGKLIVRDNKETISEIEDMLKSLHWEIQFTYSKQNEGLLCAQKTMWRP